MDKTSKRIDKEAVEEQGITPNGEHDPGAIPTPHSLPVSNEFEEVHDQQSDEPESTPGMSDNVTDPEHVDVDGEG
jgi:hypothetical protein